MLRLLLAAMLVHPVIGGVIETAPAETPQIPRFWTASIIAGSVGVGLDIASSWNKPEKTGWYQSADGRFHARGALIRGGIWAGTATLQYFLLKKYHPSNKFVNFLATINYGVGANSAWTGIRNFTTSVPPAPQPTIITPAKTCWVGSPDGVYQISCGN